MKSPSGSGLAGPLRLVAADEVNSLFPQCDDFRQPTVPELIRRLDGPDATMAELELLKRGPEAAEGLLSFLEARDSQVRAHRNGWLRFAPALVVVALAPQIIVLLEPMPPLGSTRDTIVLKTILIASLLVFGAIAAKLSSVVLRQFGEDGKVQRKALEVLGRFDDIRAVGRLAAAVGFHEGRTRSVISGALTTFLPRVSGGDDSLLNAAQRRNLYRVLPGANSRLAWVIVDVADRFSDVAAPPSMRRVASGEGPGGEDGALAHHAQDLALRLQELANRERVGETLLRPSVSPTADTLLRPAQGVDSPPGRLLRPTILGGGTVSDD